MTKTWTKTPALKGAQPLLFCSVLSLLTVSCTSGKKWVNEPFSAGDRSKGVNLMEGPGQENDASQEPIGTPVDRSSINAPPPPPTEEQLADAGGDRPTLALKGARRVSTDRPVDGRLLGVFRNTYYDFPSAINHSGPTTKLMSRSCEPLATVPRSFYEAVCVQGSGTLVSGATVSFAKRDCACADLCPRTGQKICFDQLDQEKFPWGRGAQGTAITPLLSVAVDSNVVPLGTKLYIPEYDGIPRSRGGGPHDGCFVAEDRGLKVVGEHVDIFTGNPSVTEHFNQEVPSNVGVHVYAGTARCGG